MAEIIRTYNNIAEQGLTLLENAGYAIDATGEKGDPSAVLLRSHTLLPSQVSDSVAIIARAGTGTEKIDITDATEKGVVVVKTPGANANAVAELVMGSSIFAAARNLFEAERFVHGLGSNPDMSMVEEAKKTFSGYEIAGKHLGVVGLGAIGVRVANYATALGMNVKGYETRLQPGNAHRLRSEVSIVDHLDKAFEDVDFVSLHIPAVEDTRAIISDRQIQIMRHGAVLLNFARGEVIDEPALEPALVSGQVSKYINDFPSQLNIHKNVISLPHLGASTEEAEINCAVMAAQQIHNYLSSGEIVNSVNFPNIAAPRTGLGRVLILHRNVPHMLADITEAFKEVNISGTLNQSRDTTAATLIDLDASSDDITPIAESIRGHGDILRVKVV